MGDVTATPGTFPGPTGVPGIPGAAGQLTQQQLMELIKKIAQSKGQMASPAQQQNQATPGMVGQVGPGSGQPPPIPFNTTGAARSPAPPSGQRPEAMQVPMPQNLGQDFDTHGGAINAAVKEGVGNLTSFLNNYRQKKQSDETIKAEAYFNQIMTASQNPSDPNNKKILDVLGSDPKVLKTIEKGLGYTFAKEPGGESGPEPPESHGLKAAIQKLAGKQQQPQQPKSPPPMPGQPGGILLPGPTQASQLEAQKTGGQLAAAQQDPHVRDQLSGLAPSPTVEATLSTNERIQAGHDMAKNFVALEKAQSEAKKADAAYQRQVLANQGRVDATTSVARINAQARVTAAQIAAQASLARTLGKAPKMPPVNTQNEFSSLNRAQGLLTMIMSGDKDQGIYNQFVASLKAGGKTGAAIISSIPGQGSTMQKLGSGVKSATGQDTSKDWSTVQKALGDSISMYDKAIKTTFPDWAPAGADGKKAAEGSAANPIVIGGDEKDDEDDDEEIVVDDDN